MMGRRGRRHPLRVSGEAFDSLEEGVDLLLYPGREPIAHDDTGARVPVKECIVVFGRTKGFGLFEPAHRFTKEFVGIMAGTGMA